MPTSPDAATQTMDPEPTAPVTVGAYASTACLGCIAGAELCFSSCVVS